MGEAGRDIFRLWLEAGSLMWLLLLLFFMAWPMLGIQLVFARKRMIPGLLQGWATALFSLAVVTTAVGYRLSLNLVGQSWPRPGPQLMLRGSGVALTAVFFASGMVAVLVLLQVVAETLRRGDPLPSRASGRVTRIVGNLATLGLLVSGTICLRA